ncbi:MAG: DUF937 domain-containing protein, partial [Armatimonadetes bacterium]|nr:DUF937 domain-containing protein [Armatimonadota bacterium]
EEDHDGSVLGNLDAVYANPQAFDGAEILGHIFGANREPVAGDLSKGTGLNPNATALLLQILAPIVMGLIGKKLRGSGMDAGGLSGLLGGQTKEAEAAQPGLMGSITKILDRNSDGSVLDDLQRFAGGLFGRKDN